MARYKPAAKKRRLIAERKRSRTVPVWVVAKTLGRFRFTPTRRHWRRVKIGA
jgi:large subunit ribosomal protein L39e